EAVGQSRENSDEILQKQAAGERIDPHPELLAGALGVCAQQLPNTHPRGRQLRARDGILQIEDQRVRAAAERLGLLAIAVARNEEERAQRSHSAPGARGGPSAPNRRGGPHPAGLFIISAARRQEATSSLRWL